LGGCWRGVWRGKLNDKEDSSFSEEKEAKRLLFLRWFGARGQR
jgi:hypothetical protein